MSARQLIDHHQAVRSLLLHLAACFSSLPIPSQQVLWLAAGIGTARAVSPSSVARALHITPAAERVVETRAIVQLRAAGRRGCSAVVPPSPSVVVTGGNVSLPVSLIVAAAQTVGSQQSSHSSHAATSSHRDAGRHRGAASHRHTVHGAALETAALPSTHDSLLLVWALFLLAALGVVGIMVADRRPGIRWLGGGSGLRLASLRRSAVLRRPAARTLERSVSAEEISAPEGGWAPTLFARDEAAPVKELPAPDGGWAPPIFARSEPAPVREITAPEGGWAPPVHALTPPVAGASRPGLSSGARGRRVARWRELRAHKPTTLGVAGGAIAAILAVATRPQRAIGRRHR